ncbi:MAG TPA: hypothetical protein VGD67_00925 [Pseudonocardiaceae bacterium]
MIWSDLVGVLLLALSGMLVGGAYTAWRSSRKATAVLAAAATLSGVAGVVWLL